MAPLERGYVGLPFFWLLQHNDFFNTQNLKSLKQDSLPNKNWALNANNLIETNSNLFLVKVNIGVEDILSKHRSNNSDFLDQNLLSLLHVSIHPRFQENAKSRQGMLVNISLDCLKEVSPVLSPQNMLWLDVFFKQLMRPKMSDEDLKKYWN